MEKEKGLTSEIILKTRNSELLKKSFNFKGHAMLFCERKKYVFIAVPKTGTTAIQKHLLRADPDVKWNTVRDKNGALRSVRTHSTAREVRSIMGEKANEFTFVAFIRHPRDLILSKYFFYKSGRAARRFGIFSCQRGQGETFRFSIALRVIFAQRLPFRIWAQLYPFKSNSYFITDSHGCILVDKIGRFEQLQQDVLSIFTSLGYEPDDLVVEEDNKNRYPSASGLEGVAEKVAKKRLRSDSVIYRKINDQLSINE